MHQRVKQGRAMLRRTVESAASRVEDRRGGVALTALLELVYDAVDERVVERATELAGTDRITDLGQVRAIIRGFDRHSQPTAMEIRLRAADVEWVPVRGLSLAVDRTDDAVSKPIAAGGWEPHTTGVFERLLRPGMTVVDVGANVGYFTLLAADLVGPEGRVYAFDPNPENCRLIASSIERNQLDTVSLFPVALGAENGFSYFTSAIGSNGAMLRRPRLAEGYDSLIPVFRLDGLVDGPLDLLKIDVEGAEHLVVTGGRALIERSRPAIVTEFSCDMIQIASGVAPIDYLRTVLLPDYRMFVVERGGEGLRAVDSPESLLDAWPGRDHIEDLLLVPAERAGELG
jgi:FkbM family methyltransferase